MFVAGLLALAAAGAAVALITGGSDEPENAVSLLPDGCTEVSAPEPKDVVLERPPLQPPPAGTTATVVTNCGEFKIALDTERAPKTTASFAFMVREDLYDDTGFHRVVTDFVIQGGDPSQDGTGGPGYFVDEKPPPGLTYARGLVAMAKSGAEPPGRSGSQFFVVTAPADAGLPDDYALLGEVVEGFDVVKRIEAAAQPLPQDASDLESATEAPVAPIVISDVILGS